MNENPNDVDSTADLARALNDFERRYNEIAVPFDWTFTREDLADILARLEKRERNPHSHSPPDHDRTCGGEHLARPAA